MHLGGGHRASVVGDTTRIAIDVQADAVTVSSTVAMNMGLIVTELVINAIKHAFVADMAVGRILVTYRVEGYGWTLTVSDNGVGKRNGDQHPAPAGLGTSIVAALVRQLDARLETSTGLNRVGTWVSITHQKPNFACPPTEQWRNVMDKDRVIGSAKVVKGKVKEAFGKATGDARLEAEGKADQIAGKVQNAFGGIKDALKGK